MTVARVVTAYFSRLGTPMLAHEKVTLEAVAKAVAQFKGYEFGGWHDNARRYSSGIFFVADDTLMLDEAASLGIRSPNDLFGGVGEWARCQSGATRRQRHGHEPNGAGPRCEAT